MFRLDAKQCTVCKSGTPTLSAEELTKKLAEVKDWNINQTNTEISRRFTFAGFGKNYEQNILLVSLVSEIIKKENHHPRIVIEYNYVEIAFTTHAAKGLTENDFICAAKINQMVELNKAKFSGLKDNVAKPVATLQEPHKFQK